MVIVLMGVSGSGKSTIGKTLAGKLGWTFIEGDDFHPAANVEKMRAGIPLTDADRVPWLAALRERVDRACTSGENAVLACSALKHSYQDYLEGHAHGCIHYVYLSASEELIRERLTARTGHFMNPNLLHSQFETLEPPEHAIRVDVGALRGSGRATDPRRTAPVNRTSLVRQEVFPFRCRLPSVRARFLPSAAGSTHRCAAYKAPTGPSGPNRRGDRPCGISTPCPSARCWLWRSRSKRRTLGSTKTSPPRSRRTTPKPPTSSAGSGADEDGHRHRLLELFRERFGNHVPMIRRHDVRGFVHRDPVWPDNPSLPRQPGKRAELMEVETTRFYEAAAARATDTRTRQLLGDLAEEERKHVRTAGKPCPTRLRRTVRPPVADCSYSRWCNRGWPG